MTKLHIPHEHDIPADKRERVTFEQLTTGAIFCAQHGNGAASIATEGRWKFGDGTPRATKHLGRVIFAGCRCVEQREIER